MINKQWDLTQYTWEAVGDTYQDYGVDDIYDPHDPFKCN